MSDELMVESPAVQAPVVTPVTTRDVLHRAADLLEEFGWCQGRPGSLAEGEMCAVGAIWHAGADYGLSIDDDMVEHLVSMEVPGYARPEALLYPLARFNDEPGRTRAEVVARLREAAEASDG